MEFLFLDRLLELSWQIHRFFEEVSIENSLTKEEIVNERRELLKAINGDAFSPLNSWPKEMRLIF